MPRGSRASESDLRLLSCVRGTSLEREAMLGAISVAASHLDLSPLPYQKHPDVLKFPLPFHELPAVARVGVSVAPVDLQHKAAEFPLPFHELPAVAGVGVSVAPVDWQHREAEFAFIFEEDSAVAGVAVAVAPADVSIFALPAVAAVGVALAPADFQHEAPAVAAVGVLNVSSPSSPTPSTVPGTPKEGRPSLTETESYSCRSSPDPRCNTPIVKAKCSSSPVTSSTGTPDELPATVMSDEYDEPDDEFDSLEDSLLQLTLQRAMTLATEPIAKSPAVKRERSRSPFRRLASTDPRQVLEAIVQADSSALVSTTPSMPEQSSAPSVPKALQTVANVLMAPPPKANNSAAVPVPHPPPKAAPLQGTAVGDSLGAEVAATAGGSELPNDFPAIDMTDPEWRSTTAAKAAYGRFVRAATSTRRPPPQEVMREFARTDTTVPRGDLFRLWLQHGGDWASVASSSGLINRHQDNTRSANRLYTKDELLVKFNGNIGPSRNRNPQVQDLDLCLKLGCHEIKIRPAGNHHVGGSERAQSASRPFHRGGPGPAPTPQHCDFLPEAGRILFS